MNGEDYKILTPDFRREINISIEKQLAELATKALKSTRRKRTAKQMTTLEAIPWIESLESTDKEQEEAKRIAIEALKEKAERERDKAAAEHWRDRGY